MDITWLSTRPRIELWKKLKTLNGELEEVKILT